MSKEITGRKVLFIALGAFGVIITANIALAVAAIGSFPGLEVKNSYVASQGFEAERAAQDLLGWRAEAAYADGALQIAIRDTEGELVRLNELAVRLGRPTGEAVDITASIIKTPGGGYAVMDMDAGYWRIDLVAMGEGGDRFRQHLTMRAKQ